MTLANAPHRNPRIEARNTVRWRPEVLELGTLIVGPFTGRILGEFGADVIKVEAPAKGDPMPVGAPRATETSRCRRRPSRATRSSSPSI